MDAVDYSPRVDRLIAVVRSCVKVARAYTRDLDRHDALRAASAMAFHAFFSLVPLAAITGWAAHRLTRTDGLFLHPVTSLAPTPVTTLADEEFMRLSSTSDLLLAPLSVIGFLWLSTGGVAATMRVFERIFEAPRRSWWRRRAIAFAFVLLSIVVLAFSGLLVVFAAWGGSVVAAAGGLGVPIVGLWVLIGCFFRFATKRSNGASPHGFRGAAVTITMWVVVSVLFSLYVREIASYSKFYGGLATMVVVLLWLWLMSFSLLVGGEVNARLEGSRGD